LIIARDLDSGRWQESDLHQIWRDHEKGVCQRVLHMNFNASALVKFMAWDYDLLLLVRWAKQAVTLVMFHELHSRSEILVEDDDTSQLLVEGLKLNTMDENEKFKFPGNVWVRKWRHRMCVQRCNFRMWQDRFPFRQCCDSQETLKGGEMWQQ